MSNLLAWIKSKSITSHSIAVVLIAIATLITTDDQVQQFLVSMLQAHPAIAANIILFAGIILKYSRSTSDAGAVAVSHAVMAQPDAPTAAQVIAATPNRKGAL